MESEFWEKERMLFMDFWEKGTTINSERYKKTLNKLQKRIRTVRTNRNMIDVLLLHDNAQPHTSLRMREAITTMGWTVLPRSGHSPDLAPTDYVLFYLVKDAILHMTTN
jgi:transposase